ncbi:MAG: hypothetical protein A3A86_04205 [Elusimicrobia bacterium RIFCSPLOWO2_01_FULL_60_11]|nr:MAG: hypothetical protein A3A86_04205 [Elusimicrobia bacterium RIFCSPLOWO2_01_FULL_60_11]
MNEKLSRILLVDDDPDIQTIAKVSLESVGGFSVRICGQADEAVRAATEFTPQLILLDVMMPGMDGPAVLKLFKGDKLCRGIPVVFMTANLREQEAKALKNKEVAGVIAKPFDPMTLPENIRRIWKNI